MDCSTAILSPATLLVVDNEDDIRDLFALVLEQAGYTVITAVAGDAAISLLNTTPIDLVLTDYEMPDMRGDQLIATIRTQYLLVKTILATGHPHAAQLAAQCGADGYYRKGEPAQQLLARVAAILDSSVVAIQQNDN